MRGTKLHGMCGLDINPFAQFHNSEGIHGQIETSRPVVYCNVLLDWSEVCLCESNRYPNASQCRN